MIDPIFVDASAWVAITNRTDRHHREAQRAYHQLLSSATPLITSTWTAYEALSIVKTRLGYDKAEKLWERIRQPFVVSLVKVTEQIEAMRCGFSGNIKTKIGASSIVRVCWLWKKLAAIGRLHMIDTLQKQAGNTAFHWLGIHDRQKYVQQSKIGNLESKMMTGVFFASCS